MGLINKLKLLFRNVDGINRNIEHLETKNRKHPKVLSARILAELNNQKQFVSNLSDVEFQVFSQWGDDGIIQYLISHTEIPHKTFIEFGVENYIESNTRYLLVNNNWAGMVMDGSPANIEYIKNDELYWTNELHAVNAFVTAENINELVSSFLNKGYHSILGILSIDVDGMDYWIWKALHVINPVIVIAEYNSVFGPVNSWTIPYSPSFQRTQAHHSNLYYGASLSALCQLAEQKGYDFLGCNSAGNNAYFILKEKNNTGISLGAGEGYIQSKFRESRDKNGGFTFLHGDDRLAALKNLPVVDLETGETIYIK
jgi:hypothetical protein